MRGLAEKRRLFSTGSSKGAFFGVLVYAFCAFVVLDLGFGMVFEILSETGLVKGAEDFYLANEASFSLLSVALASVGMVLGWIERSGRRHVVTDRHLACISGLFSSRIHEMDLDDVRHVKVRQAFVERIIGGGTVVVFMDGDDEEEFEDVDNPYGLRDAISNAAKNTGEGSCRNTGKGTVFM